LRLLIKKKTIPMVASNAPSPSPTPIPAFAPVERPPWLGIEFDDALWVGKKELKDDTVDDELPLDDLVIGKVET